MLRDLFSLFPAYAGVILSTICALFCHCSFPRIRGGDPKEIYAQGNEKDFSPHTRG